MDVKALELVYKNCESKEELAIALKYHGISEEALFQLAKENEWQASPISVKSLPTHDELEEVDADHIDATNKASIRRLNSILELAITKFSLSVTETPDSEDLSMSVIVDQLERLVKTREKLTKLEMPLYGLTTAEPLTIQNPFNIYFNDEDDKHAEEAPANTNEDGSVKGANNENEDRFI